ncbi:MAG TPA: lysophospholipid acyltransferase family protein [Pyrinomonadaceae bacterium]|nr:lysophospholipid acyltransferase family protein [Pyrinomonadaceae bacterium]
MARKGRVQTNLEYSLARGVLGFFRVLPLPFAIKCGRVIARFGFWFPKLRRVGEHNLKLAFPDLSDHERSVLLRGSFANLGRLLAIFSRFTATRGESLKSLIACEGLEQLEAATREQRGVILFTGHVGAWELSSFALSLFDHPLSFLVRRLDNPKIEAMVDRARTSCGNRTIDKISAAREMLGILREGGTLGILVDLNTLDREAIFVDFFGIPAATTFIVAKLALRTGAAVLPVFAPWDEARQRFVLKIDGPLHIERTGDEAVDVHRLTQQYTRVVEDYIRRYPEQWLWIHRRWKTRPDGEAEIY